MVLVWMRAVSRMRLTVQPAANIDDSHGTVPFHHTASPAHPHDPEEQYLRARLKSNPQAQSLVEMAVAA
jgi:hypothetical protein